MHRSLVSGPPLEIRQSSKANFALKFKIKMTATAIRCPDVKTSAKTAFGESSRRCTKCHIWQPITSFRFRNRRTGTRHAVCTSCAVQMDRLRRQKKRASTFSHWVTEIRQEIRRDHSAAALAEAISAMIDRCGGVDRFVERWVEAVDFASRAGRWSSVLRQYAFVVDGLRVVQELLPRLADLTDEQLDECRNRTVMQLIQKHPAVAVWAAHCLGWQVIPPEKSSG